MRRRKTYRSITVQGCVLAVALLAAFCRTSARADEQRMQSALELIHRQEAEYEAALSITPEERRHTVPAPDFQPAARDLWRSVRAKVSTRTEVAPVGGKNRTVPTYEFEQEWATPAVVWLLCHPNNFAGIFEKAPGKLPFYVKALLSSVQRVHYASPLMAQLCPSLAFNTDEQVYKVLDKIYTNNPDPTARGTAALAMSIMLANPALTAAHGGAAKVRDTRILLIRQALLISPQEAMFGSQTLTDAASEQIYRIRRLSPGSIPPRFTVTSPDGKAHTFPQLGKVNLIFFWSPTEDIGLSIMQKQAALLRRYPDLQLCPITEYTSPQVFSRMPETTGVPVCYQDDPKGSTAAAYRVTSLPFVVLINPRARVLYIGFPDMQLQTALDRAFDKGTPLPSPAQHN